VSDRSGVSRGDRNRNARLARLREAVPVTFAIAGIDLADAKQMVVVSDHESRVRARRAFRQLHRPDPHDWARPPGAAPGGPARGLGRTEVQPRLRRPVHPSDQPGAQPAIHRPSPRRLAAALLRHLHAVITTGQRWDPAIAASGRPDQTLKAA
jgi:hypothetical protein